MTMQEKTLSFEQLPELIQNLVERIEALDKTVREKHQPQPLEKELMSVEDVLQDAWQIKICGVPNGEVSRHPFYPPR